jgi:hypothetical protein
MAAGIALLVTLDAWLAVERLRYARQVAGYRRAMSEVERRRTDAILDSKENRSALMVELWRRQATSDPTLNLSVSLASSVMRLQREGAQLREMPVHIGPEVTIGDAPGQVRLVPPQGKRAVLRVLQGGYRWEVPAWVYAQRGQAPPADRAVPGALGPVAVVLSGGTVIYSRPAHGPLADEGYVLPGSVRAREEDLLAVVENLGDGTPVYFF